MKHHLVSVIMPCHNGERYIELSVRSVLAQTYQNWELLVIDDASTDASVDIVQAICQEDARVKLLINDNPLGLPYAPRNFGIARAQGDYIAFLDSDDLWKESHLENLLKVFEGDSGVVVAFSWYSIIDGNGHVDGLVRTPATLSYHHLGWRC